MRQIRLKVPGGQGLRTAKAAEDAGGFDISVAQASDPSGESLDIVDCMIPNDGLEALSAAINPIPDVRIHFQPTGALALRPPDEEASEQVKDVSPLSPIEVFLSGLQSIGSWTSFLAYAAAAGVIVWIGLYTETVYLLIAAMLIAPYAGPAMTAALGTARGDIRLFRRSLARYAVALTIGIVVAWALSMAVGQQIATNLMVAQSRVASVAILLPLVAGAAGALNLCQSQRSSMVSGAATGMLVAASLAPPAGLIGMGVAIGQYAMAFSGLFLLLLQIAAINLSGSLVFRIQGVRPDGERFRRGRAKTSFALWIASVAWLAALLAFQLHETPQLQRSTIAQSAAQEARSAIRSVGAAQVVRIDASFTRGDVQGQDSLLVTGYVQSTTADRQALADRLNRLVERRLSTRYNATPLADIRVLAPPDPNR